MTQPKNRFRKDRTSGDWIVEGHSIVTAEHGDTIIVTRQDGTTTQVVIGQPGNAFVDPYDKANGALIARADIESRNEADMLEPHIGEIQYGEVLKRVFAVRADTVRTVDADLTDEEVAVVIDMLVTRCEERALDDLEPLVRSARAASRRRQKAPPPVDEDEDMPF